MIWLCITSVLLITAVISDRNIDTSHIRVFPAANQSIAGVFQVSDLNYLNQPQYAFNASEARRLCSALGVNIASKSQVQKALRRGLETCRFGWIDEHLAVIPRIKALSNCGKNQTGLVTWRTSVTEKFDVFCFNESDAAAQLKDATTDSPLNRTEYSGPTQSPSSSTRTTYSTSSSETADSEAEAAPFVGGAESSAGAKAILITSTCALLLITIIILAYLKMRRSGALHSDMKQQPQQQQQQQQEEYIQTEEWTCVKNRKETTTDEQEDERIEVDDDAS